MLFFQTVIFYRHSVWSQVASAFLSLCLFLTLVNIPGDVLIMKDCIVQCNSVIQTNSLRNTWAIIKLLHAVSRGDVCLTSIWISVTAWVKQEDEKLFPLTNYNFKMTVVKFVWTLSVSVITTGMSWPPATATIAPIREFFQSELRQAKQYQTKPASIQWNKHN